ncbi:MAG: aminotransferase class III-fold pyridoxal phosphate-dependent enzyme, partial [Deltaproteobacteria bacterium]|nr:aminotransferase class III-fold pyridoxal phosphate-dependent enzyme [Deltaproteobacteria bacterium]
NNMTALVNGHAHPYVVEALQKQLSKGTVHGFPVETNYKLAEMICNRVPSIDSLRFTNTGSEATLFAMRAARGFTGKEKFIKIDGGYHGNHDYAQVNLFPDMATKGLPRPYVAKGIPTGVVKDMLVTPFNDLDTTEKLLKENKGKVAAIMLEPVLGTGGGVAGEEGYLKGLRQLADQYEVLLIFDEIITFRVHEGGWQTQVGVKPDLTTLGKVIGGGFPIGAFGGRKDIMDIFDPTRPESITHSGTFTANAMTMTAGLAGLEIYSQKEIDRINTLGEQLTVGMEKALADTGTVGHVTGNGSLAVLYFTDQEMKNARDVVLGFMRYGELMRFCHLEMMNRGVYFLHRGMFSLCTPMIEAEINKTVAIFKETLEMLKPLAEEMSNEKASFKF